MKKETALTLGGIGIFIAAIIYSCLGTGTGLEVLPIKGAAEISATEYESIGQSTRDLYILKNEFSTLEAARYTEAIDYESQLRAKQVEIESKENEISISKDLPVSAANNQALGSLTRELYVLKGGFSSIDSLRYSAATNYESQLMAKQAEADAKEAEIIAAQTQ